MAGIVSKTVPSLTPEAKRARFDKWKQKQYTKQSKFTFNYCNEEDRVEIFEKIKKIKCYMAEGNPNTITTFEMLNRVMDYYMLCISHGSENVSEEESKHFVQHKEYQMCSMEEAQNERNSICSVSSIENLIARVTKYAQNCSAQISVNAMTYLHHAMQFKLSCEYEHYLMWTSSPYINGGKLLVNIKMLHGIITSGNSPG